MANLNDILTAAQQAVQAIRSLTTALSNTFLQQGAVTDSVTVITAASTITFTSSVAAGFLAVTTSSGISYYLPLYR